MFSMTALALAGGEGNIIQPDGSLVLILVLFLIFIFIMNRLFFRPIGRVLDEREALTDGAVAEARAASRQYQSHLADYEATIRQARAENYKQLEQRRTEALQERQSLIEEAKRQASEKIESAKVEIARQAKEARASLEAESRQIADQISRTVLGRAVGGGAD